MRFHGRNEIEHAVPKWEPRHGAMPDFDPAHIDPASICSFACDYALLGKINAEDPSLCRCRGLLANRSAATTTYIENRVVLFDGNVRQTPICEVGMTPVHAPQNESAQPSCWLLALSRAWAADDDGRFQGVAACFNSNGGRNASYKDTTFIACLNWSREALLLISI